MQGVQNIQIDGAGLLEGVGGNGRQDGMDFGAVSAGTQKVQQTETLTKGEHTAQVTYQKPQEQKAGTAEDVMQQAEHIDAAVMKNQMVVAANTTTTTDCKKMEEEGFSLQQTDAKTVVTVTDKIKMELAKAGVDISYFGDQLSADQLEELAGNAALAQKLSSRIDQLQADLPLTAENVQECKEALEEARGIHKLNEGALKYMLDNQLEPTIGNLYKAQHCGSATYVNQDEGRINFEKIRGQISRVIAQAGQTADDQAFADSEWLIRNQIPLTPENLNMLGQLKDINIPQDDEQLLDGMIAAMAQGMRPQDAVLDANYTLEAKAQKAVTVINQAADEDLAYLISKGEPVTIQNLEQAHNQNLAGDWSEAEKQAAAELMQSIQEGEQAAGSSIGTAPETAGVQADSAAGAENAGNAVSGTDHNTESGTDSIVQSSAGSGVAASVADGIIPTGADHVAASDQAAGRPADGVQEAAGSGTQQVEDAQQTFKAAAAFVSVTRSVSGSAYTSMQIVLITARRQLEEVRLIMTVESSYQMLKQGISVDTSSMEELIHQLKEIENSFYKNLLTEGGVEATQANISLFAETSNKLEELKEMPAYAIGARNMEVHTLEELHQEGGSMQQNFQQANERYETMQTQVRKDLGDSIEKAFRNVDDILKEIGQEISPANERAVRILGYNRIEITPENMTRMKAADQQVQMAFHNLTPSVIREFINRGVNPLDLDIQELNKQAEQIRADLKIDAPEEKYSEYLYKLEQNHSITQEERSSYIGIYRLMNHIVESDGAAVGALVNQGAQITMRNLLAAVRTQRHGEMDITVDQSFGELQSGGYADSITDQIEAGYQQHCVKQALQEMSPERLRAVANDTGWEDLTPEQFLQQIQEAPEDLAAQESYYQQQLNDLVTCAKSSKEAYQVLERYELPNTMLNVMAATEYMKDRNSAYRRFFSMGNGRTPDASISTDAYMTKNDDGSVEVDFAAMQEELLERFGEDVKKPKELAKAMADLAECAEKCMSTMIMEPHITSLDIRGLKLMNAQMSMHAKMAQSECFSMPIVVDGQVTNVTMKIVRHKEQKGLVNITMDTARYGKIAAELRAKDRGFSGYIASNSRQTRDMLKSLEGEIAQALQEVEEGPLDMNYILSSGLDLNYFEAKSGVSEEPESEELREVQTKTLYGMAEVFIRTIRHLDAA